MPILCPYCRATIPTEDINVATDIALCRACGRTSAFSDLVRDPQKTAAPLDAPPPGAWFEPTREGFRLGATTRTLAALYLIPFTLVWSGMSMSGLYGTQIRSGHFNLFESLFGLPFAIGTVALVSMCAMAVAGKIELTRTNDRLIVFAGVGPIGWTRRYTWSDFLTIREDTRMTGRNFNNQQHVLILEGRTRATFGTGWSEPRRYFILSVLRTMLRQSPSARL